ncbi:AfsR/SARP family transcriptional regulator [Streptomyces liangshanensis]|uniref:AfsR/SARP family transcriptional regulator n=1 Tax=Streptomyces liangshanensis TaxID=2717324 RepID=A0A6G9H6N2_9ACTN|nr:BTAD domain-containing putative transcriptional regulator [Streptomyces liangshanensis]QIQ06104.1 AfsR/SARP family transcriptional regulator [Streptomyces liangshanensis]
MMRFELLGPVRAWCEDEEVALGTPQQRAVLALLLLHEGHLVETDTALDVLWGERAPRGGRGTVRTYVYRLRPLLGGAAAIESASNGYVLRLRDATLDVTGFLRLTEQGYEAGRHGDPGGAARSLRQALGAWRGQALAGIRGVFFESERDRLEELRLTALEELHAAELQLGERPGLTAELRAAVAAHPLRERLHEQLMLSLYRSGRRADALAVYREARRTLREELGVDPGAGLARLHTRILHTDPALDIPQLPSAAPPPAASTSSSPNSSAPRASTSPPPAPPSSAPWPVPSELPPDLRAFTGRAAEIAELTAALDDPSGTPVAGVTGLGGTGMTTLAVRVGHLVSDRFPDGRLHADLGADGAPADPVEVLGRFLRAVGVDRPAATLGGRAAQWRTAVAGRRLLVVLDNADSAEQVRPLLPASPGCAVLLTARRRIVDLPGVHWHRLGVLPPDDALELLATISGRRRVYAEREAAERLVAACSYHPLSVGVAAARLAARPSWTIDEILAQLEDDLRQPVVMHEDCAIVDRPFRDAQERMDTRQRAAFHLAAVPDCRRLTPEAAAALLDLPVDRAKALMEALVDLHVVETGPGGYRYLGLVKAYARRQAPAGPGRERALRRLLRHYLADGLVGGSADPADVRAVRDQVAALTQAAPAPVPERAARRRHTHRRGEPQEQTAGAPSPRPLSGPRPDKSSPSGI